MGQKLGLAAGVGVLLGMSLYYLKPEPRSAIADPSTTVELNPSPVESSNNHCGMTVWHQSDPPPKGWLSDPVQQP
ncbi:MAG: hypothetical protein KatS3mg104_0182 [Phycisphaerae bacterium]|jgi:hypothetical protein|nr:MAG: hypothetical protein KatS3mg104_0182 [Phycisphaerae bacterium]